jgi:hypothetical protein
MNVSFPSFSSFLSSRVWRLATSVATAAFLVGACASTSAPPGGGASGVTGPTSSSTGALLGQGSSSSTGSGTISSTATVTAGDSGAPTEAGSVVGPGTYAINPPKQCDNQFSVPNCQAGVSTSACGGTCSAQSACEGTKPNNPDVGFLCSRFILFGDEMVQAAKDDWASDDPPFNYAIVGHDNDTGGLDGNDTTSCCQCYQLVFSNASESEANVGGTASAAAAITVPKPLIVQAFNTSAGGGHNFDVFMGAGGFGGNNACDPKGNPSSQSGKYMYTQFPPDGEPGNGGEKVIVLPGDGCEDNENHVTTATLSSTTCQAKASTACSEVASGSDTLTRETIQSCEQSNAPDSYYHLNWNEYAKRVECPTHLTEVTGCKLAPQGLPQPDATVITAAAAAADSSFHSGYTTTTMQDCCKPTCAWQDEVTGAGETAVGQYNSFYTCDQNGVPVTE